MCVSLCVCVSLLETPQQVAILVLCRASERETGRGGFILMKAHLLLPTELLTRYTPQTQTYTPILTHLMRSRPSETPPSPAIVSHAHILPCYKSAFVPQSFVYHLYKYLSPGFPTLLRNREREREREAKTAVL